MALYKTTDDGKTWVKLKAKDMGKLRSAWPQIEAVQVQEVEETSTGLVVGYAVYQLYNKHSTYYIEKRDSWTHLRVFVDYLKIRFGVWSVVFVPPPWLYAPLVIYSNAEHESKMREG